MTRFWCAIVFLLFFAANANAFVLNEDEEARTFREVMVEIVEGRVLTQAASEAPAVWCNYFGYKVRCLELNLKRSKREQLTKLGLQQLEKLGVQQSEEDRWFDVDYILSNFGERRPSPKAVQFVGKRPGYVPGLAYDDVPNKLLSTFHPTRRQNPWRSIRFYNLKKNEIALLRNIEVKASNYLAFSKMEPDDMNWFFVFAEISDVIDGDRIAAFWRDYEKFSDNIQSSQCERGCQLVIRQVLPSKGRTVLSRCSIASIGEVLGAPEDCMPMMLEFEKKTYVRAARNWVGQVGADGGADDIICKPNTSNVPELISQVKSTMSDLNKNPTSRYVFQSTSAPSNGQIMITNRYTPSAFFYGKHEISTIRIWITREAQNSVRLLLATTFFVAEGDKRSPEQYRGISRGDQSAAITRLYDMLPTGLNCELLNP